MMRVRLVGLIGMCCVGGLLLLLLPSTARAQAGGSISGLVTDSTGGILPGATVDAASPVLIEGKLSAVSDSAGRYTIVNLRPGTYTVTFTLSGFQTVVREGLVLTGDAALQVNAQLPVGQLEQSVTVTGQSPLVDVQQVRGQFVTTREMMDVLPGANTFAGRALLIPGVSNQGMADGQYWPAAHGNTWRDAQTANDGMRANVIIDDGQWQMGWEMNQAATAELSYDASGAPAEVQTGGVLQNAIPKEGGNTFAGTFFTSFGHENLSSSNADADLIKQLGAVNRLAYDYDFNPGFGGPILKNKLWFFGAYRYRERKIWQAGSFFTGQGTPEQRTANDFPAAGTQGYLNEWASSGLARITYGLSNKHKVRFGFERISTKYPLVDTDNTRPPESADRIPQPVGYHTQLRWTSTLTNKLLLEAGLSVQFNKWRREQFEWNAGKFSSYNNLANNQWQGAFWITGWQPEKSRYLKTSLSYVTGSHNFKAGFEDRWGNVGLDHGPIAGDVRTYFYFNPFGNYNPVTNTGMFFPIGVMVLGTPVGSFSANINHDIGVYAQDKWTLNKWTLNLGVRYDSFSSGVPPQEAAAGAWVPARSFGAFEGANWNTVVPRVGVAYDLFGNGKTAIKAAAYKYVNQESTTLAMAGNPMSSFTWSAKQEFRGWSDLDGNGSVVAPDGSIQYNEVGASPDKNWGTAAAAAQINVPNRPGQWEFNTIVQHELLQGLSVSFGWYRRNYYDFYISDNIAQGYGDYTTYNWTVPNDPRLGSYAASTVPIRILNPSVYGNSTPTFRNAPNDLRDRRYDGFEWVVNGRRNKLFFGASANLERTFDSNCDNDNPNINLYCADPRAWLTQFKGHAAYTLPYQILASAFLQGYPGPQQIAYFNLTAATPGVPAEARAALLATNNSLAASNTWNILPPEVYFLPYQTKLDLRFSRQFTFGKTRFRPDVDIFNVLNSNTVLTVNNTCCAADYMKPLSIMQARNIRFGVQVDW